MQHNLKQNTAVLGWGRCNVDGIVYGNKTTGQSPSDVISNGSFSAPMMSEFIRIVNNMSINSSIEIASAWIDAAITANTDLNFQDKRKINTNCFNAVSIATDGTKVTAYAIEALIEKSKPSGYTITKREVWNYVP